MNRTESRSHAVHFSVLNRLWCPHGCLAALMLVLCAKDLASQGATASEAKPLRIDVTPLIGYRTSMTFSAGQNGVATSGLRLDASPSYGVAAGVRLDEEDLVEFRWARQDTHVHLSGSSERVILNQFHGDFTHEYILENWPAWARPFVIGSVGATHLGAGPSSFTRFSFGLGGGIKVYFNRHIGLRAQAEWLPLVINPAVSALVCGGGCVVHLNATLVSQGEIVVGPIFRF